MKCTKEMQMRIAVCDDEKNIRKKLVGMLDEIREICAVELEIEECNDGDVLFNGEYDLILLDIEMPKMNGLLVKERLEKTNTAIVFITSHKELMPDAFGKNVYGCSNVGNELLNVTISHIQKQYGIALECSGRVNEKCKVIEGDICIIVSNLLKSLSKLSI